VEKTIVLVKNASNKYETTKKQEKLIVRWYLEEKLSPPQIAKRTNVGVYVIRRIILQQGLSLSVNMRKSRKFHFNESYFDKINMENTNDHSCSNA